MASKTKNARLSDYILEALHIAISQEDILISEALMRALELSITRKAGGAGFKERREYPEALIKATDKLDHLKKQKK